MISTASYSLIHQDTISDIRKSPLDSSIDGSASLNGPIKNYRELVSVENQAWLNQTVSVFPPSSP